MIFWITDRWGEQKDCIGDVLEAVHKDKLNGEDSLTLLLPDRRLQKGDRVVWKDKWDEWHEHIVNERTLVHEGGEERHSYYCENSIAETMLDYVDEIVAEGSSAQAVLAETLSGTRWSVGTVDNFGTADFYWFNNTVHGAISHAIELYKGEYSTEIGVAGEGVSTRELNLQLVRGEDGGKVFTYGHDMAGIHQEVGADDVVTRLHCFGKGAGYSDPEAGYVERLDFTSINDGKDYIDDDEAKLLWGLPDGNGGVKHAEGVAIFEDCDDETELLERGRAELAERNHPHVSYTASLAVLSDYGYDYEDARTGDTVALRDRPLGLRLQGRVTCMTRFLVHTSATVVEMGDTVRSITDVIGKQAADLAWMRSHSSGWDGAAVQNAAWLTRFFDSLNEQFDTAGGHVNIDPATGITVVDNPTNPTMAMQINGMGFRIANSKTSSGAWNWRTFGTGAGFAADEIVTGLLHCGTNVLDLVNGVISLNDGTIQDTASGNYWNLGTGELRMAATSTLGGRTVQSVLADVDATITDVDVEYAKNQSTTTAPTSGWSTTAPAWQSGYYIWQRTATTTAGGTTYSDPTCISGRDGVDGSDGIGISSTAISYGTSASESAEPSSWSATAPTSVSQGTWLWTRTVLTYTDSTTKTAYSKAYVGTNGTDGTNGTSVTVSSIQYGTSASASTEPSSWSTTAPTSLSEGTWLWVKTNYSDGTTATTKSYVGTDGEDGASVYVQSSTKVDGTTTVVLANTDGTTTTITIDDGADGSTGMPGANGYVHVAWANSADGSTDFSTSVSTDKSYLGVYTDNTAEDSQTYSDYSWSKIEGETGATGTGVSAVVEQYYLSTSSSTQTGGSWSTEQPTWASGKYIWTRSQVTWTDGTVTTTTPVLAKAVNSANETANAANTTAISLDTILNGANKQTEIFNRLTNNGATQGIYLQNGRLYVNGTYIQSGALVVKDANDNDIFRADISDDAVTVGGFSVSQSALYNGLSSLSGTSSGVYLGTTGLAVSDGSSKVSLDSGKIIGYNGTSEASRLVPTSYNSTTTDSQGVTSTTSRRGMRLRGQSLDLRAPVLSVRRANDDSNASYEAVDSELNLEAISSWSNSVTGKPNVFRMTLTEYHLKHVLGMLTQGWASTDSFGQNIDLSMDGHTHDYSDLSNTPTIPSSPSDIGAAAASHTHSYSSLTGKPTIPTSTSDLTNDSHFLVGTYNSSTHTLTITTT